MNTVGRLKTFRFSWVIQCYALCKYWYIYDNMQNGTQRTDNAPRLNGRLPVAHGTAVNETDANTQVLDWIRKAEGEAE